MSDGLALSPIFPKQFGTIALNLTENLKKLIHEITASYCLGVVGVDFR